METEAQLNNFYNDVFTGYCNLLSRQKKMHFLSLRFFENFSSFGELFFWKIFPLSVRCIFLWHPIMAPFLSQFQVRSILFT